MPKTTLLLTLYSKSPYLSSFIDNFLSQLHNAKFMLLVADGSHPSEASNNNAICTSPASPFIRYHYFGVDSDYNHYVQKIFSSLQLIETPYVLIADQDDLFNLSALAYHEHFLDNNPAYIASRGLTLSLVNNKPFPFFPYSHPVVLQYFRSSPCFPPPHSLSSFNRLFSADGWNNMYSVFRVSALLDVFSRMKTCNIQDINAWEYFFHLFLFDLGKIMYLSASVDHSFYLRREGSSLLTSSLDATNSIENRIRRTEFTSTFCSLYKQLSVEFRQNYSLDVTLSYAYQAFSTHFIRSSTKFNIIKQFLCFCYEPISPLLKGLYFWILRLSGHYRFMSYYSQNLEFHV